MNNFSEDIDINVRLNNIFKKRFDIDLFNNQYDINIEDNLLGRKFKLRARDLIYLLYDIEKEFDIEISEFHIDNIKFNNINNIRDIINDALNEKEKEAM
ncbi:peptide maturation system acyl carrier-related protein [Clostridium senegalense]|uniref:peptide maturation system acyl carrier-related protein n=1 Tax=Clostridium senegalense TaxID=1465809 RepID=UPI00031FF1B3|nr:peptide maturation system acyl carrier-related protein [Clostridium senegalense]